MVDKTNDSYAIVRVLKKSACGENCASCKGGCVPTERSVKVKNTISAKVGERVVLEMKDSKVLTAAFIVYILPMIVFFSGYFVGGKFFDEEGGKILTATLFALLTLPFLKIYDGKNKEKYMAEIVKRISGDFKEGINLNINDGKN